MVLEVFGGLKYRNLELLAKWGGGYLRGPVRSGETQLENLVRVFQTPWISISKVWFQVEVFAILKLGDGKRISLWERFLA